MPLTVMHPEADVPVLQLSLPSADTTRLLALGQRLRALGEEGVLVVGSGVLTHGLQHVDWRRPDVVPGRSADVDAWAADMLGRGDVEELAHFRTRAPGMPYAHPTVEHFRPLFVTLGAATDPVAGVRTTVDGYFLGLSERSFQMAAWLPLVQVVGLLPQALDKQLREDAGIPHVYYQVLAVLSAAPEASLRMSELARGTAMSVSRLSHAVTSLEERGWVSRRRCPRDRRGQLAQLTDLGREVLQQTAPGHVAEVRRLAFDARSPDEVDQLRSLTTKVLGRLTPLTAGGRSRRVPGVHPLTAPHLAACLVLLVAGWAKTTRPAGTAQALRTQGLPAAAPLVRLLGAGELALGAAALAGLPYATAGLAVAYAAFTVFVLVPLLRGRPLSSCGCFGEPDLPPTPVHPVGTALLAGCAAATAGAAVGLPALLDAPTGTALAVTGGGALTAWLVVLVLAGLPRLAAAQALVRPRPVPARPRTGSSAL